MKIFNLFIISCFTLGISQAMAKEYQFTCWAEDDYGHATIKTEANTCTGSFTDDENQTWSISSCYKDADKYILSVDGEDASHESLTYTCTLQVTSNPNDSSLTCNYGYTCIPGVYDTNIKKGAVLDN